MSISRGKAAKLESVTATCFLRAQFRSAAPFQLVSKPTAKVKHGSSSLPGSRHRAGRQLRHIAPAPAPPRPHSGPGRPAAPGGQHSRTLPAVPPPAPAPRLSREVTGTPVCERQNSLIQNRTDSNPAKPRVPRSGARVTTLGAGAWLGLSCGGSAASPHASPHRRGRRPPGRQSVTGQRPARPEALPAPATPAPPKRAVAPRRSPREPGPPRYRPAHLARIAATWRRQPRLSCCPSGRPRLSSCRPAATGRAGEAATP